jgi:uncharacterized membrane protein (Fun14 family)
MIAASASVFDFDIIPLMSQGLPIVGGALVGFCLGWLCRKLIKIAIIGIGLILALLAYLEYHKSITVNWDVVNNQVETFVLFLLKYLK